MTPTATVLETLVQNMKTFLYERPIDFHGIAPAATIYKMKEHGWYEDMRGNQRFQLLNKRFYDEDTHYYYRILIRFEQQSDDTLSISSPLPFAVVRSTSEDGKTFQEHESFHGRKMKNRQGYLDAGVPASILEAVVQELKTIITYV